MATTDTQGDATPNSTPIIITPPPPPPPTEPVDPNKETTPPTKEIPEK